VDPNGPIARRFPLVARVRPVCLPLSARVGKLAELANTAEREAYQGTASSVFNQAALLASDLDLPDLARQWCHRHAAAYLHACPLVGMDAIRGLEPLVNLARLNIRAGLGDQGHQMLRTLYEAVTEGTAAVLDGLAVPTDLTATDADRQEVRQWLWRLIVADGTRALTSAGRWQEALAHVQKHHGIGKRMLDGRQVAVLARATTGDHDDAQQLLADTAPGEPWENAVTACLTALCRPPDRQSADHELDALLAHCRQLDFQTNLAVFHTRLALSAIDAAGHSGHPGVQMRASELVERIVKVGDGYAAREVLAHDRCARLLTKQQTRRLAEGVDACSLGDRTLPAGLQGDLSTALDTSETVIRSRLTGSPCSH